MLRSLCISRRAPLGHWVLLKTGRYAHSGAALAAFAEQLGFRVLARERNILRWDSGAPIPGAVLVLCK